MVAVEFASIEGSTGDFAGGVSESVERSAIIHLWDLKLLQLRHGNKDGSRIGPESRSADSELLQSMMSDNELTLGSNMGVIDVLGQPGPPCRSGGHHCDFIFSNNCGETLDITLWGNIAEHFETESLWNLFQRNNNSTSFVVKKNHNIHGKASFPVNKWHKSICQSDISEVSEILEKGKGSTETITMLNSTQPSPEDIETR